MDGVFLTIEEILIPALNLVLTLFIIGFVAWTGYGWYKQSKKKNEDRNDQRN